jgi:hypothetical protein
MRRLEVHRQAVVAGMVDMDVDVDVDEDAIHPSRGRRIVPALSAR